MIDDGVLRIPIQLNGKPGSPANMKLLDRELFINNSTGVLYYGDENGKAHIITVKDYNHGGKLFNFGVDSENKSKAVIGGLSISTSGSGYKFQPLQEIGNYNVQFSGIKLGSLVLTSANYGSSLPSSGVEGQIFFLIP